MRRKKNKKKKEMLSFIMWCFNFSLAYRIESLRVIAGLVYMPNSYSSINHRIRMSNHGRNFKYHLVPPLPPPPAIGRDIFH